MGLAICRGGIFMAVYPDSRQGIICHCIMPSAGKKTRIKLVMQLRLLLICCNWEEMKINEAEEGKAISEAGSTAVLLANFPPPAPRAQPGTCKSTLMTNMLAPHPALSQHYPSTAALWHGLYFSPSLIRSHPRLRRASAINNVLSFTPRTNK